LTNTADANLIPSEKASERIKHEFQFNTCIDVNPVLTKIKENNWAETVQSFYREACADIEITDFQWSDQQENPSKFEFTVAVLGYLRDALSDDQSDFSEPGSKLHADFSEFKAAIIDQLLTKRVEGELELTDNRITNIELIYEQNRLVTFFALYEFTYTSSEIPSGDISAGNIIKSGTYTQRYRICSVPLPILNCWRLNKTHDPAEHVEKPSAVDSKNIIYGSQSYPVWLCELIRSLGIQAFKIFYDAGFVNKLVYDVITEGIPQSQVPHSSELRNNSDNNTKNQALDGEANRREQLAEIRIEDQKRLRIIHGTRDAHKERSWARILEFKSPGGSGPFIKRMSVNGFLVKEKVPGHGFLLKLTDKALRILYPSQSVR